MTPWLFIALALAGGLGAGARFGVDMGLDMWMKKQITADESSHGGRFGLSVLFEIAAPARTAFINITGSFILGLFTGLALKHLMSDDWKLVLGTGFLGGYTTFSTASIDAVRLSEEKAHAKSALYAFGTLVGSVSGAALGWWIGSIA